MKAFNTLKKLIVGSLFASAIAAAAIVAVLASPVEVASAETPPPAGPRPPIGRPISGTAVLTGTARLEAAFKMLTRATGNYDQQISRVNEQISRTNQFVATQKAAGKNTSAIETAVINLQAAIPLADAKFDEAKALVDAHAGFDAAGKVTNETTAKQTVQDAHTAMRGGEEILRKAQANLMQALRDFRRANPPTP